MTAIDVANTLRNKKFNLEELLNNHAQAKMRFFISAQPEADREGLKSWFPNGSFIPTLSTSCDPQLWKDVLEDISCEVDGMLSSYISPALHFNNYIEWSALDIEWDEIKFDFPDDDRPSNVLRRISAETYAASTLLAIKSGLDRLVRILFFYYSGISHHTTWGRYDKKGKTSGFMSVIDKEKSNDQLLEMLNSAYSRWINKAVAPRDSLTHYSDATSNWHYLSDHNALIQTHAVVNADNEVSSYGVMSLSEYVVEWYKLADQVFLDLSLRSPRSKLTTRKA